MFNADPCSVYSVDFRQCLHFPFRSRNTNLCLSTPRVTTLFTFGLSRLPNYSFSIDSDEHVVTKGAFVRRINHFWLVSTNKYTAPFIALKTKERSATFEVRVMPDCCKLNIRTLVCILYFHSKTFTPKIFRERQNFYYAEKCR